MRYMEYITVSNFFVFLQYSLIFIDVNFVATVKLPAEKFVTSDESPTMSLEKKIQQVILNSGEEIFAEIR